MMPPPCKQRHFRLYARLLMGRRTHSLSRVGVSGPLLLFWGASAKRKLNPAFGGIT